MKDVKIIEMVNRRNRESTCSRDVRLGWNMLLEEILHTSGTYKGYRYLTTSEVPPGQLPGIFNPLIGPIYPDETRRSYI
jgi:hypothetical protein